MKKDDKNDPLTKDDKKVWKQVAKTVTPLGEPDEPSSVPASVISIDDVFADMSAITKAANKKSKKYNSSRPQRVLDLHGMTRDEAYKYLQTQLNISKMRGHKCVEVITGRGHGKGEGLGILKRKVPLWMEGVKFGAIVKSWKQVPGNDGAIYVYLR